METPAQPSRWQPGRGRFDGCRSSSWEASRWMWKTTGAGTPCMRLRRLDRRSVCGFSSLQPVTSSDGLNAWSITEQWFSKPVLREPPALHMFCVHSLIYHTCFSSLVDTARQNVRCRGACRTGLKTTDITCVDKERIIHIEMQILAFTQTHVPNRYDFIK